MASAPPVQQPAPPPPYVTQPQQPGAPPQYAPYPTQYAPPPPQQYAPPPQQYPQYVPTAQFQPPAQYQPQAPAPPQYQPPAPQYQPPPPQQYAPPAYAAPAAPAPRSGLPTWLLTVAFAVVFVGVVGGIYWVVGSSRGSSPAAASPAAETTAADAAKTSPVQKYVEVSGIRFTEDAKKKILVKFTVTNHSDADLSGLAGNVTVWAHAQNSEKQTVGTFSFKADVGPDGSKEVSAPLTTQLKMYELPDWQNVTTDLQVTAPQ